MRVLGIESSCDETGVAIYDSTKGIIAHALHSQISLHQTYGGVVPELASRDHLLRIVGLVEEALAQANLNKNQLDAIAYTAGPGLIGALLTGASFAKSFALGLGKPALAIHHLEAHVLAAKLDSPALSFPFLALLVSGGHTQLITAHALGEYELIGETLDDAVGEAFDKTAKLMGLPYPGGARLAALAEETLSIPALPSFPRPMTDRDSLDLSFSGLKTHALTMWNKGAKAKQDCIAVAKAFQEAIVETLLWKCQRGLKKTGLKTLVVAGGVGANQALRERLSSYMQETGGDIYFPRLDYCTDNGVMVAYAGYLHCLQGHYDLNSEISVKPRWPLNKD